MGRKAKYTFEQKLQAVLDYQSGKKSAADIALELDMGKRGNDRIRQWTNLYKANGPEALNPKEKNSSYSKNFKEQVVQDYIQNGLSQNELAAKYNISSTSVIIQWIKRYNNHIEQRDYDPHPEVYMAERKKTTKEERMEIVQYCIDHDRNYKETAAKYGCSYSQVNAWVHKYDKQGMAGLADNRGHRKAEENLTDKEKLERENKRLKEELKRKEIEVKFLKKLNESGRGR
ncbi:helix-turn-helix domain-containing protein [Absicoccus porci]|jgi:transposase-like protein|uniref:helix-turn-helix domain-containing protein n=1 Tax=Absicoccus porci TaxID=2486576 RepID=UPI003D901521